jgi:hypothetical protein
MDWQPIETAPRGVSVLVFEPEEGPDPKIGITWMAGHDGVQWVEEATGHIIDAPTHWMPIPAPPPGFMTSEEYMAKHPISDEAKQALDALLEQLLRDIDGATAH